MYWCVLCCLWQFRMSEEEKKMGIYIVKLVGFVMMVTAIVNKLVPVV